MVWLFPERGGRAKLFVLFLDQNGCESNYSPIANRLSGRTRELASIGSGTSPRRAHVTFTIIFLTAGREAALPVLFPPSPFPWRNSDEGDVRGCIPISEALSMHQGIYCPGPWDTSQVPSLGQELSSPLRVDSFLWRCDSAGQHSNAISLCGFASRESNHFCTFLESLGYLTAVAETPNSSLSTCHLVRRGAKSHGSCLGYLWHGAREDWARGHRRVSARIPQNIPC